LFLLTTATALLGGTIAGCSTTANDTKTQGSENEGSIGFKLDVGGGASINTMHVVVYGNSLGTLNASTNIVKDIDVSGITGNTTSFTLTLPQGTNYQVRLSSADDATCAGSASFNVTAGVDSSVSVTLTCGSSTDTTGNVDVTGVTTCTPPTIQSAFIGPNTQVVGKAITLDAHATTGASYLWAAIPSGAGTFAAATSPATTFTCQSVSTVQLQLVVGNGTCSAPSKNYTVNCIAAGASGGTGGAAGAGGSSAGTGGTAAGAGGSSAGTGGTAAGAGGSSAGTGGTAAGAGGSSAGTGGTAAGSGGSSAGSGGVAQACPSPVTNTGSDGATITTATCSAPYTVNDCGANCASLTSAACLACETNDFAAGDVSRCSDLAGQAATDVDGSAIDAAQLCLKVTECARTTNCGVAAAQDCYCGSAAATCFSTQGAADGPCKALIEAGLGTTVPANIFGLLTSTALPGGLAMNRIQTDHDDCGTACFR
jgi:hypothetical protein